MRPDIAKTFNTSFASRLFKLIVLLSVLPSFVTISSVAYNESERVQEVEKELNHQNLKSIVLNGLKILELYRSDSSNILREHYLQQYELSKSLAEKSKFKDIIIFDGESYSNLKKGQEKNGKYLNSGRVEIDDHIFLEGRQERFSESIFNISVSLNLFDIWHHTVLADSQVLCVLTDEKSSVSCTNSNGLIYSGNMNSVFEGAAVLASWNLFMPGYGDSEQISFYLLSTRLPSVSILPSKAFSYTALFYILSNLVFVFLLIQLLRKYTKPIDRIKDIQNQVDPNSSNLMDNELRGIGDSLISMNSALSRKVETLSVIKEVSEASFQEKSNLSENLIVGMLAMDSISACAFFEIENNLPKCLYFLGENSGLELHFEDLDEKLNRIENFGINSPLISREVGEALGCSVFSSSNSVEKFVVNSGNSQYGILLCELSSLMNDDSWHHIYDVIGYSKLAFQAKDRGDQLKYRANNDVLTGLLNRERMGELVTKNLKDHKGLSCFIFIDLDNFKFINDSKGHAVGDNALKIVASLLRTCLHGEEALISRFGGDEFNVFLKRVNSEAKALYVARLILDEILNYSEIESIKLSASMGVVLSESESTYEELLRQSDIAMYSAKGHGKSRFSVYTPQLDVEAKERAELDGFVGALDCRTQLDVVFQPKVDRAGLVSGFEALSRFKSDSRDWPPFDVISHAEQTGKIMDIGYAVFRRVCSELVDWKKFDIPCVPVSVNVSPVQLQDSSFAKSVLNICVDQSVRPNQIEIEITESELIELGGLASASIRELHQFGFKLILDDFGTGYSSFSYLSELPFSGLKVDKSLTEKLIESDKHRTILEAIVKMAHHMNMKVTVEGVESESEKDLVNKVGSDDIQGYFFSRPLDVSSARNYLVDVGAANMTDGVCL
ncbi:putative bifunctional diguanylate cyclase/phosphodiesterase [Pseudoteredinibacter isoporae]|uniref:putative bifunctional diguanylate cyclase/phosphodiesterase n=1 Tax=Pseudoteredinibacter isoporae TaxID=570281 RepID=UPI003109627B